MRTPPVKITPQYVPIDLEQSTFIMGEHIIKKPAQPIHTPIYISQDNLEKTRSKYKYTFSLQAFGNLRTFIKLLDSNLYIILKSRDAEQRMGDNTALKIKLEVPEDVEPSLIYCHKTRSSLTVIMPKF